ncbi:MAG: AAA family ATPase [Acidimicrobiales bacterium]|nr:AAA family ATPase [Acidimicrobiales bacterium]
MARRTIGRVEEQALLRRLLDRPAAGPVVVVGQAGIGKTTLLEDLAAERRLEGHTVVRTTATSHDGAHLHLWRRPAFELGFELPLRDPSVSQLEQVWELTALLADALESVAPVLLIADDLHWADDSSLTVLGHLGDQLGREVRIVAATRGTDSPGVLGVMKRSQILRLGPLSATDTTLLVESIAGTALDADELDELHARTGGVPLLVREVVGGGTADSGPAEQVLRSTLLRAGDDALDTLSLLALGGLDLPLPSLASACDLSVDALQSRLDRAIRAGVLVDVEPAVRFAHDLLAEAAVARLTPAAQRHASATLAHAWRSNDEHRYARHLVEALPTHASVSEVVEACEAAAMVLSGERRSMDAARLVSRALSASARAGASPTDMARLYLVLGEAHWDAGDAAAAVETFATGAALAVDDVELVARLEVGRHRQHNHFEPDTGRDRLRQLDRDLGPGDSELRVQLLGRLAALAQQAPVEIRTAEEATTTALAMARRLESPGALAQAIHDRFLWLTSVELLHDRDAHAQELVAVARRAGRTDLAMAGLQWRLDAELNRHDIDAALRTVDESSVLAALSRRPLWQIQALAQRARMEALLDDPERAFDLVEELADVAAAAVPPLTLVEWSAHEMFTRMAVCRLHDTVDPLLGDQMDRIPWIETSTDIGNHTMAANVEWAAGRIESARGRAVRWLARAERYAESVIPMMLLAQMGRAAADIESPEAAAKIRPLLQPLRGRVFVAEQIELVDLLLARLALLLGDADQATKDATAALAAARALRSRVFESRCLDVLARIGRSADHGPVSIGSASPVHVQVEISPDARVTVLRRPKVWTVSFRGRSFDVRATTGLTQLGRLLAEPGHEFAATELAGYDGRDAPPISADLGPVLDAQAKRAYRRRLLEVQAAIDESDRANDVEHAARARLEYDALLDELRHATGLSGRDRPQGSGHERARVNVTRSVRRAISAIAVRSESLGTHLERSVRTGAWCCYEPDPTTPLRWELRD